MKAKPSSKQSDSEHSTFSSSLIEKNGESFFPSLKGTKSSFFGPATLQPKLKIGQPDDEYEQEADRVADAVMRMPDPQVQMQSNKEEEEEQLEMQPNQGFQIQMKQQAPELQRMCPRCRERARQGKPLDCPDCEKKLQMTPAIQRQDDGQTYASPEISSQLHTSEGQGAPLPSGVQQEMSHKMGPDFSSVNIHTDSKSHQLNQQLGARAFTHGSDIYFNKGEYNPASSHGKRLLAHELTHVIQQRPAGQINHRTFTSQIQKAVEPIIQCSCQNLEDEFDLEELSRADRRLLTRRIRECAAQDVDAYRRTISNWPQSPANAEEISEEARTFYTNLISIIEESLETVDQHEDESNRRIRRSHLESVRDAMLNNKLFAYYQASLHERMGDVLIETARRFGDPEYDFTQENLEHLVGFNRTLQQNPERIVTHFREQYYYENLNVERTDFGESALVGATPDESEVTDPALPAEIIGSNIQVKHATGTYTMRLDYSVAGPDLLSQVVEAMNWINYSWEIYDITDLYRQRIAEEVDRLRRGAEAGENLDSPQGPTRTDEALEEMRYSDPSEAHHVGRMDAAARRWERMAANQLEDLENNWQDFTDPMAGSEGTVLDAIGNQIIAEFNLATTSIAAGFASVAELLNSFADLLGGSFHEKEIPFPDRKGWFLIRCVAQPSPQGDEENPIIRPASVATKIVQVKNIEGYAQRELEDMDALLEARKIELETNLRFVTDPDERRQLEEQLASVNTEMTGSTIEILELKVQQLEELRERTSGRHEHQRIDEQLSTLREQLRIARERGDEFTSNNVMRPRAVFVSEETSQTYPLLLQLGQVSYEDGTYHYRLSDVSNQDGGQWDGYGSSKGEAVTRAFNQFSRESPYGRGLLVVELPEGTRFSLSRTNFECEQRGGAMAVQRLEQLATVLTILGLMAVPGVGQAAAIIGAAVAAGRIISRIENHTFRWDTTAVTDMISILGAAATGVATIGRMRVVRTSRQFALVADDADVARLIQTMNTTASRLELVDEFVNWGGYIWGNIVTLNQLSEIRIKEIRGEISHAEARRQRAHTVAGAIRDGAFQFAGFDPEETSRRVRDSLGGERTPRTDTGTRSSEQGTGEADRSDTPTSREDIPPQTEDQPERTQQGPVEEGGLPGVDEVPGDTSRVPTQEAQGVTPEDIQAEMGRLNRRLDDIPASLRELLAYDHNLRQRAIEDRTLITPENIDVWNEIGQLAPMNPETYPMLLANAEVRRALLENPGAQHALKHCASPCFPSNASADDITALQALIVRRAERGLDTDYRALNEFLYENRSLDDLGDVIEMLNQDFEGTLERQSPTTEFDIPGAWAEGSDSRPPRLSHVVEKFMQHDLPHGLANAIFENILALSPEQQLTEVGNLNSMLAQRNSEGGNRHIDRILYGLSDPDTFQLSRFLMERAVFQSEQIRTMLNMLSVVDMQQMREGLFPMTSADFVRDISTIIENVQAENAQQILDLVNRAGYPAPEEGTTNPDLQRLVDLLRRQSSDQRLTPNEVIGVIEEANSIREGVAAGELTAGLDAERVRDLTGDHRGLIGALLSHLNEIIVNSDAQQQLIDQMIRSGDTEVDRIRFREVTEVIRGQIREFIRTEFADQLSETYPDQQLDAIVNRVFGPVRGALFELVNDRILRNELGSTNVWREVALSVKEEPSSTESTETRVDNVGLAIDGNVLRVIFFEYKSGERSRERTGQSRLRGIVEGGGTLENIIFDSPRGREVLARIQEAQQNGRSIRLEHRLIEESPGNTE